jgi:Ni/Co efflux regulator RcnB/surface antigen
MKRVLLLAAAAYLATVPAVHADPDHDRGHDRWDHDRGHDRWDHDHGHRGLPPGQVRKMWRRGERLPLTYVGPRYFVAEPHRYHLAAPRRGYRWVVVDHDAYLVEIASGLVADVMVGAIVDNVGYAPPPPVIDRDELWRKRYAHNYSYADDSFYRDCQHSVDPAGVIGGALIGGLVGNAAGHGHAGATVAGIVVGGAVGAALTRHLDCGDRGFAYKTYSDGFNSGRPGSVYEWRNPKTNHYGTFRVGTYYTDPDGFRCANYTQRVFIDGRPQAANGRACQQPDGTWAVVS